MSYDSKPIITIKEARKLLGKEHKEMTDVEVLKLIEDLHFIAKHSLKKASENREEHKNNK